MSRAPVISATDLASCGLARAGRALDQHRLLQPVGEVHDAGDALVGEVVDLAQAVADGGDRLEAMTGLVRHIVRRHQSQVRIWPFPVDDVLRGGELAQAHGPAGVQLLGADADLGAEAELLAVDEPGRRVDEHRGGVDLAR